MARSSTGKAKAFFRSTPSGAFDQYLQDIQKLPLIKDPEEERRLARRVQKGDERAAERLVTANLRFVISYVKKYQGHGLDLSELVAIGNEGLLQGRQEVRSRSRCEVHLVRGVVGPAGRLEGPRGADPERPDSAESEFSADLA